MPNLDAFNELKKAYEDLIATIHGQNKSVTGPSKLEDLHIIEAQLSAIDTKALVAKSNSSDNLTTIQRYDLQALSNKARSELISREKTINEYNQLCSLYKTQGETLTIKLESLKDSILIDKSCAISNAINFIFKSANNNLDVEVLKQAFPTLNNPIIKRLLELNKNYMDFRNTLQSINELASTFNFEKISPFESDYQKVFELTDVIQVLTQDPLFIPNNKDKVALANPLLAKLVLTRELSTDNIAGEGEHNMGALNNLMDGQENIEVRKGDTLKRLHLTKITEDFAEKILGVFKGIFTRKSDENALVKHSKNIIQEVVRQQKIRLIHNDYPELAALLKQNPAIAITDEATIVLRYLMEDIAQAKISNNAAITRFANATGYVLSQGELAKITPKPKILSDELMQGHLSKLVEFNQNLSKQNQPLVKLSITERILLKIHKNKKEPIPAAGMTEPKVDHRLYVNIAKHLDYISDLKIMLKLQGKLSDLQKIVLNEIQKTEHNIIKVLNSIHLHFASLLLNSPSTETLQSIVEQTQTFYHELSEKLPQLLGKQGGKIIQKFDILNVAAATALEKQEEQHTQTINPNKKGAAFFLPGAGQSVENIKEKLIERTVNGLQSEESQGLMPGGVRR